MIGGQGTLHYEFRNIGHIVSQVIKLEAVSLNVNNDNSFFDEILYLLNK